MAKKKTAQDPFERAGYAARAAGEKSQEGERPAEKKGATYRIGEELINRINATAVAHNVLKSDLVKFLLMDGLDRLESGDLRLPTTPPSGPRRIEF